MSLTTAGAKGLGELSFLSIISVNLYCFLLDFQQINVRKEVVLPSLLWPSDFSNRVTTCSDKIGAMGWI